MRSGERRGRRRMRRRKMKNRMIEMGQIKNDKYNYRKVI